MKLQIDRVREAAIARANDEDTAGKENLLIASSSTEALRVAKAFGLEKKEWSCVGLFTPLNKRTYRRIVVMMPDRATPAEMNRVTHLPTHVAPGGELSFL